MKKVIRLLILILMIFTMTSYVYAEDYTYVDDQANLFSESEKQTLDNQLGKTNGMRMDVLTLNNSYSIKESIQDYFDSHEINNGVCYAIDIGNREWYIKSTGNAIEYMNDDVLENLEYQIANQLSDGDYYESAITFAHLTKNALNTKVDTTKRINFMFIPIGLVLGMIISFLVMSVYKGQLKTVYQRSDATYYTNNDELVMRTSTDQFINRHTERFVIQKESRSMSGPPSGGHTHGGSTGGHF